MGGGPGRATQSVLRWLLLSTGWPLEIGPFFVTSSSSSLLSVSSRSLRSSSTTWRKGTGVGERIQGQESLGPRSLGALLSLWHLCSLQVRTPLLKTHLLFSHPHGRKGTTSHPPPATHHILHTTRFPSHPLKTQQLEPGVQVICKEYSKSISAWAAEQ